ncbi:hypothetical protein MESS2_1630009 [Mesorhizobium metallidurans STM 2683]|uniref:Uncharacterized protein n=1 Tax=Mesorhizobium metallidurans STM 2683 TaxID=1297569 RepID=M5EMT7_9HYPH|nr:hypothetical protein MESS2_1630009 [Mesorhizobium metallidurans STM 2683]
MGPFNAPFIVWVLAGIVVRQVHMVEYFAYSLPWPEP